MNHRNEISISKEIEQYENDLSWIINNYNELIQSYGDKFIAVKNEEIVGFNSQIKELKESLLNNFSQSISNICIEYIYKEDPKLILYAI